MGFTGTGSASRALRSFTSTPGPVIPDVRHLPTIELLFTQRQSRPGLVQKLRLGLAGRYAQGPCYGQARKGQGQRGGPIPVGRGVAHRQESGHDFVREFVR